MRAIQIQNELTNRENSLQAMQGVSKLTEMVGQLSGQDLWDDPQAKEVFWGTVKQYPSVVGTPQFNSIVNQFEVARRAKEEKEKLNLEQAKMGIEQQRADAYSEAEREHANYWKAQASKSDTPVVPEVRNIEGKKFIVNPKTGAVHQIDKTMSKKEFMLKNLGTWMRDLGLTDENEAKQRMSKFYDENIADSPTEGKPTQKIGRFDVIVE